MQSGITKKQLLAGLLSLSMVFTAVGSGIASGSGVSAESDGGAVSEEQPIAEFNFNNTANNLADSSGKNVQAAFAGPDLIIGTEKKDFGESNSYLDLSNSNAYLSLDGSILNGLTEITVEMNVLTKDANTNNWAFFAAPNENSTGDKPTYLGVLLNSQAKVERFANGREHDNDFYGSWTTDEWHKIRVVFAESSTTLYIDDNEPVEPDSTKLLADCLGVKQEDGTYSYEDAILWFGHASWGDGEGFNGYIDDISISGRSAEDTTDKVIVSLDFEDDNGGRLVDKSGNSNDATNVGGVIYSSDLFKSENGDTYLDLSGNDVYLSLTNEDGSGVLNGLKEMTLEMQVLTKDTGANWAFFAAPDGYNQKYQKEHYLGILLNDSATVERYANNGARPANRPTAEWTADNKWHTIRVVFKISSTILRVDEAVVELGTPYSLKDCVGENGDLWLGHSSWGEYFNGCIDDIKIWDHAIYDPIDEDEYILTESVSEPRNTTVNMFDYWITGQYDNDYRTLDYSDDLKSLLQGINKDHLFLFAGDTIFNNGSGSPTIAQVGFWNRNRGFDPGGDSAPANTITQGIVKNTLGADGYPVLALDTLVGGNGYTFTAGTTLNELWNKGSSKQNESLAYLFAPSDDAYKASYPNVTGLFQTNNDGYYEFHSWETFAELNVEQETGTKTSTDNNHITLYDRKWGWGLTADHRRDEIDEQDGQFFPFNDWSDMFFMNPSTGDLEQAHKNYTTDADKAKWTNGSGQTTTDEPLNHYFGMTVETKFQQPIDGKLDLGGAKKENMKFDFSGDDDVWIFIDDVLVGDLGGIHGWKDISIDFSTGKIEFAQHHELDTTLADMFKQAGVEPDDGWKEIKADETEQQISQQSDQTYKIFSDNSVHTLKFFYLERGNQFSNCNITFNLQTLPEKTETKPGEGKTVTPGDTIDYEISWDNFTGSDATLTIKDELDDNVDFVSASYGGVTLDEKDSVTEGGVKIEFDGKTVIWTLNGIKPQEEVTVELSVKVKDNIKNGDIVINQAVVTNSNILGLDNKPIEYPTEKVVNPLADLEIKKAQAVGEYQEDAKPTENTRENPLQVKVGDEVTYYLTVTVYGTEKTDEAEGGKLDNIIVRDTVPEGLTYLEGSASGKGEFLVSYDENTDTIKWSFESGKVGEVLEVWYTVTVPHVDETTEWANIAYATYGGEEPDDRDPDPDPNNPTPSDPNRPRPKWKPSNEVVIEASLGSLKISKKVVSDTIDSTKEFEFTVVLKDSVGNDLDENITYICVDTEGEKSVSGSKQAVYLKHGETVTFKGLPAGTQYTVEEINVSAGYKTTVETAGSDKGVIEKDNTASVVFVNSYIPDVPILTIKKEQSVGDGEPTEEKLTVEAGDKATYYITVRNNGEAAAENVVVTDEVPSGLILDEESISHNGVLQDDGTIVWSFTEIEAGSAVTVSFTVTVLEVDEGKTWKNVGAVSAENDPENDPDDPDEPVDPEDPHHGRKPKDSNEVEIEVLVPKLTIDKEQSVNGGGRTQGKLTVEAGDEVTYCLKVTNNGTAAAENVIVSDVIPKGLTLVEGSISELGEMQDDEETIVWNLGNMAAKASVTVSFKVTVPEVDEDAVWENVGAVSAENDPENDPEDPDKPVDTKDPHHGRKPKDSNKVEIEEFPAPSTPDIPNIPNIPGEPKLNIEKTQSVNGGAQTKEKLTVDADDTVTYYITVTNIGTATAKDVVVTDEIPEGLTLNTIGNSGTRLNDSKTIVWKIGDLEVGAGATVSFTVTVPKVDKDTSWKNIAAASFNENPDNPTEPDPDSPHKGRKPQDSNEVEIAEGTPELSIEKTQSVNGGAQTKEKLTVEDGDSVTYYLTVTNTGTATAKDVVVTDEIPEGLTLNTIGNSGTRLNDSKTIAWKIGDLEVGASATVSFTVTVPEVDEYTVWRNIAMVSFGNDPENPDDSAVPDTDNPHRGRKPKNSNAVEIEEEPAEETTSAEASITEPPVVEPEPEPPFENAPPTTSDDNFNLDDDGNPRGDMNLPTDDDRFNLDDDGNPRGDMNLPTDDDRFNLDDDGNPRGDMNLPTGVVVGGGVVGITAGSLIAATVTQAIGKRRRSRKDK